MEVYQMSENKIYSNVRTLDNSRGSMIIPCNPRPIVKHVGDTGNSSDGISSMQYQPSLQKERSSLNSINPCSHYTSTSHRPRNRPAAAVCRNDCHMKHRISEIRSCIGDTPVAGDVGNASPKDQMPGIRNRCKFKEEKSENAIYSTDVSLEKIQTRLKYLEESNRAVQGKTQNLITENKSLISQLGEERTKNRQLESRIILLQEDFNQEREKLKEIEKERAKKARLPEVEENGTSTDVIPKVDRGVHVWALCKGCQRKLESCERQPPTVTITKGELETLEKDMQTLRDAVLARENAWDKAMEREQNYRQQLTRLTAETITARHLSDSRQEELQAMNNTLLEREMELKSLQKHNLYLNKLIAKLYDHYQRSYEETQAGNPGVEISDKDQKIIDDIMNRMSSAKVKKRPGPGCSSNKPPLSAGYQRSPRESRTPRSARN